MVKTLERALAEVATLPEAAQEKIAKELLAHIAKLRALRTELDKGIASLDAGEGRALDIEDVIARARRQHGKA
jgi:Arc/MetJ-type ribon-helix-helix transcriptional regulator